MNEKQTLIQAITEAEWNMFTEVNNQGGRASCQDDKDTFLIMRESQLDTWNEAVLESYLNDLETATAQHRNMLSEKYGYMMEYTVPQEFEKIRELLPEVSSKAMELIRNIVAVNLEWEAAVDEAYPHLRNQGRPLYSKDDTPSFTSVETYMTGELKTYSEHTLQLLWEHTKECRDAEKNLALENLKGITSRYGYDSPDEAEKRL